MRSGGSDLLYGERPDDGDCWFRVITSEKHLTKAGGIHHSAFAGNGGLAPPTEPKDWSHELSGRIRSECTDPVNEAIAYVERGRQRKLAENRPDAARYAFCGFMVCRPGDVRGQAATHASVDVVFTPNNDDDAHCDAVMYQDGEVNLKEVRQYLADHMQFALPSTDPQDVLAAPEAATTP